jgi:hypothetical protein
MVLNSVNVAEFRRSLGIRQDLIVEPLPACFFAQFGLLQSYFL